MCERLIFAHRGASYKRFENTMAAFRQAHKDGADGIEIDVQMTSDGIPVVLHDSNLHRLAGKALDVSSLSFRDVSTIRVGKPFTRMWRGAQIPTLYEVAAFCSRFELALNVELKETIPLQYSFLQAMIDIVSVVEAVHMSSFDYRYLQMIKELNPSFETALILKKKDILERQLSSFDAADAFHLHKRLLKEPTLSALRQTSKPLRVYGVVGNESFMSSPLEQIIGWITDYPHHWHTKRT